jgi:hypothetical protein
LPIHLIVRSGQLQQLVTQDIHLSTKLCVGSDKHHLARLRELNELVDRGLHHAQPLVDQPSQHFLHHVEKGISRGCLWPGVPKNLIWHQSFLNS